MPLEPTVIPKRLAPERGNGAGATVEPEESSAEREVRVDELPSPHPKKLRRYLPLVLAAIAASLAVRAGVRWWQARKSDVLKVDRRHLRARERLGDEPATRP